MDKLENLFYNINYLNNFAKPKFINEDKNYYYFNINNGFVTEISKDRLKSLKRYEIVFEARDILNNYKQKGDKMKLLNNILFFIGFVLIFANPVKFVMLGIIILLITFIIDDGTLYYK